MGVVATNSLVAGRAEPYLSIQELQFSPTAAVLDLTNLVPGGTQQAQNRALSELIVRASSKADSYCLGRYGTLNATSNTENMRTMTDRYGRFKIHPPAFPILEIVAFNYGVDGTTGYPVNLTSNNCWIERESFVVVPGLTYGSYTVNSLSQLINSGPEGEFYVNFTYVNGWPNTFTSSSSIAGATSLNVTDPTGIYPGTYLTIWDGQNDEYVQVSSSYVAGSNTVTLVNPLEYAHGTGVNVSDVPPAIKQAVIHFVVAMVKQRGQGGFVLQETGEGEFVQARNTAYTDDDILGYDLLDEFKLNWGLT